VLEDVLERLRAPLATSRLDASLQGVDGLGLGLDQPVDRGRRIALSGERCGKRGSFEDTIWQVARWRDGRVMWIKSYPEPAEAEAAGLSE
jgi:hypothetical protein